MSKRLTTSATNIKIFGVCGGIGEYLNVDPVLIRVIVIAATIMTGIMPGIIAYIACAVVIPRPSINRGSRGDYYSGDNQNNQN